MLLTSNETDDITNVYLVQCTLKYVCNSDYYISPFLYDSPKY